MTFWTPPYKHRPMSTSGSIIAWFLFFWILIPAYMLWGATWLMTVVGVNAIIITFIATRWSLIKAWKVTVWSLHQSRVAVVWSVAQLHH